MPELPSFSVEKPESATALPVELPSGLFRNLRSRGMEPVFGLDTFQDEGMSSDRSLSCSSLLFVACKINHEVLKMYSVKVLLPVQVWTAFAHPEGLDVRPRGLRSSGEGGGTR